MPVFIVLSFSLKCLSVSTRSRKSSICPKPKHKHLTTVIRIRQNDPVPDPLHWSVVSIMLHCHCLRLPEPAGICKLQAAVGGAYCWCTGGSYDQVQIGLLLYVTDWKIKFSTTWFQGTSGSSFIRGQNFVDGSAHSNNELSRGTNLFLPETSNLRDVHVQRRFVNTSII